MNVLEAETPGRFHFRTDSVDADNRLHPKLSEHCESGGSLRLPAGNDAFIHNDCVGKRRLIQHPKRRSIARLRMRLSADDTKNGVNSQM